MNKNILKKHLFSYKGSISSYPFGPEALVFKVMGKMFALVSEEENILRVTLKCAPDDGALLVGQFDSVIPGYYMNKKHWITISLTNEISDEMLTDLVDGSYKLVVSKLTKAEKIKLGQQ